jgi:uncharacterized membrane protein YfcA
MIQHLWLIPLGFVVGAFGTLIGAGGGFVLMPILLLLYPREDTDILTSISLVVVFFNALSGSWAYGRMRRIDYKSGLAFAVTAVPGAVLGALTTNLVPRRPFDGIFGVVLIAGCIFLLVSQGQRREPHVADYGGHAHRRHLVDAEGRAYSYAYDLRIGVGVSFFVGYLSSFLGIGGGIIHVPALVRFLDFPVHLATATSHFILAITALAGTAVHVATGTFSHGVRRTVLLSVGVLLGAQLGAWLSNRLQSCWMIRVLAIGLGLVGLRILLMAIA